jgi:hypothetical protein
MITRVLLIVFALVLIFGGPWAVLTDTAEPEPSAALVFVVVAACGLAGGVMLGLALWAPKGERDDPRHD